MRKGNSEKGYFNEVLRLAARFILFHSTFQVTAGDQDLAAYPLERFARLHIRFENMSQPSMFSLAKVTQPENLNSQINENPSYLTKKKKQKGEIQCTF